ncbi:FKBP-type peptidyl-prolyl cis-trans isomerase [Ferrimonas futtsuensis]|uniref:FKBP-type peptidyl-prolyl cis-trans isomerase n=1 Tax=Ferrimonas futtsuensis TaxID=364764 RepID=UPI0003F8423F|nr:FKBP-type peptidyl-prolyl cis-trans isomerase [Ferrimonas futtsuensis]
MKTAIKPLIIALAFASAPALAQQAQTDANTESYAIGASLGNYLNGQLAMQEEFGLSADLEQVLKGFEDAVKGQSSLDKEALIDALNARAQLLNTRKDERKAARMKEVAQASRDYLSDNAGKPGVTVTESGLQYEVLVKGEGKMPAREDAVTVHYKGQLVDGTVFQDTRADSNAQPRQVALINSIAGWEEGLQLMPVGSTYKFTIPAELGYGMQGMGAIPPGSALVFEIELIDANKPGDAHKEMGMGMGMGAMGMGAMGMGSMSQMFGQQ